MESLVVKRKSLAGKHRHEWKRGFLAATGFPTFLRRANPPPWLEDRLRLLSGEDEALTRRKFKPESPSPEPDTVFPPPQRPQLSPGALEPRQESRKLLRAPRRHPLQGALAGQGAGEATRIREGEGHGPGIQFHNLFGTPCATLGAKQRTEIKPPEHRTSSCLLSPHYTTPSEIPQSPKGCEPGQMPPTTLKSPQTASEAPRAGEGETPNTFAGHRVPATPRRVPNPGRLPCSAAPGRPSLGRSWILSAFTPMGSCLPED
ncbi:uncharacterized protein LOC115943049 [Leptonychotes weddellii]|uniref:Uncharacterized protein LOC115943049 n=1 Tax=Leptonychotes weddellii TaxID=9713 RepID=A0A7F8RB36_LEPWE|nr:uncharacterized protein LOC115943049 [Leptonychotes weddellii]